jgi:sugar fermentation stimulation protein A
MKLNNLIYGTLLKRYKRFFADVQLDSGEIVVAHCPNTGPMTTAWQDGWKCAVTKVDDPKRKLQYTLQFTNDGKSWIGVNTHLTNSLVKEALTNKLIPELAQYAKITPEFTYEESRLDFCLEDLDGNQCFVEVKNVSTLGNSNQAVFPDTKSDRAAKHLETLSKTKKRGFRTIVLFIVQREHISEFSPNFVKDKTFSESLLARVQEGVEVLVYTCDINLPHVAVGKKIDFKPTK